MKRATFEHALKRGVLGCLLAMVLSGVSLAEDIRASSLGRIEALSLESGQVVIEGHVYSLEISDLTVVQNGRVLDPGVLHPGMDVAFGLGRSSDGQRTVIRAVKILNSSAPLGQDD